MENSKNKSEALKRYYESVSEVKVYKSDILTEIEYVKDGSKIEVNINHLSEEALFLKDGRIAGTVPMNAEVAKMNVEAAEARKEECNKK